ncbi:MAG: translational GTPase TypA [Alphaproteobacteria bacterium]|jgi:GTP-binding protein|nr:translational GTPase TypA [Alphaproteobacteria bacterium]MBT5828466.1 translational GTPase TypA [Alphaproteobacteria bacterium]
MSIRNIAIIAHVDHGKTTLIDSILQQSGVFHEKEAVVTRVMDSNDLEKERGITILAKCTAVKWKDHKVNIIDTPGHADFGGEVERVLSMVDGVVLLVDAAEGPMPQTKFVLSKALALGLKPIVVINKIDRPDRREDEVLDEVFDLFVSLDANDEQLDFPTIYASGRAGWTVRDLNDERKDITPLMDLVLEYVPEPNVDKSKPFAMLATILQPDSFLGPTLTGKVYSGIGKVNQTVKSLSLSGEQVESARLTKLFTFEGIKKVPAEIVEAGDIVVVAGLPKTNVSDSICDPKVTDPIKSTPIDPPTMSVTLSVNDSPLAGKDGSKVTSRMIRDRLMSEAATNVAITYKEADGKDSFEIGGRGELQLGVLIENMRREGFEMSVSRPKVLFKKDDSGKTLEPIEEVVIDVDDEYSSSVIDRLNQRKADMKEMKPSGDKVRLIFHVPSRGMIGFQGEFLTITKGSGILNRIFHDYAEYKGELNQRKLGVLISMNNGEVVGYALNNLQDRGIMFVNPGDDVYTGMIIGEHSRDNDLEVNVQKSKQLTNFRASGKDDSVKLTPPKKMTLEQMMAYIEEDELVEVTPNYLRLRKIFLDANQRKKKSKL